MNTRSRAREIVAVCASILAIFKFRSLVNVTLSEKSISTDIRHDCLHSIHVRTQEMKQHFAEAEAKFGLLDPQGSWAGRSGILNNQSDRVRPIDCHLFQSSDTRIIYFLHIHKAGGTSFCASARANYHFANFNENCNAKVDGHCYGEDSSSQEIPKQTTSGYQFVANEWPLCDVMDSNKYRYVVQLRKSRNRYHSHYTYASFVLGKKKNSKKLSLKEWLNLQPDNFSTRMLCGVCCLQRPKFQLTRQDFMHALRRLEMFDNVVLLEDFESTYGRFASEVGWTIQPGKVNTVVTANAHKEMQNSTQSLDEIGEGYTILDDALYEFATALVNLTGGSIIQSDNFSFSPNVTQGLNKYFHVSPNNCTTPCCQECLFFYKWGKHMNNLFINGPAEPASSCINGTSQFVT